MLNLLKLLLGNIKASIYGDAKWMGFLEKRKFLSNKNNGIVLGKHRLDDETSRSNMVILAPTRQGKSSRIGVRNIFECTGNIVVTDPSGELLRMTSGHMAEKGYKIQVYQPDDLKNSQGDNPLDGKDSFQDISKLAESISKNKSNDKDEFWSGKASSIIYISIVALKNTKKKEWIHLPNVRYLINQIQIGGKGINNFMKKYLDDISYNDYLAFIAQSDDTLSSCLSSAQASLDTWKDPDIAKFSSISSIDIPALRHGKTIIYVVIPEKDSSYYSFLANLFYSKCFDYCMDNWDPNVYENDKTGNKTMQDVYFFLDEFGNLGNIHNFSTNITTLGKRGCSVSIFIQTKSQIRKYYGRDDSDTIINGGTVNKLILGGCDYEICKEIENILGIKTEQEIVFDVNGKERMITTGNPLMPAHQIRMLEKGEAILISSNKKPVKLSLPSCYEDRKLKKLIRKEPFVVESDLSVVGVEYVDIETYC